MGSDEPLSYGTGGWLQERPSHGGHVKNYCITLGSLRIQHHSQNLFLYIAAHHLKRVCNHPLRLNVQCSVGSNSSILLVGGLYLLSNLQRQYKSNLVWTTPPYRKISQGCSTQRSQGVWTNLHRETQHHCPTLHDIVAFPNPSIVSNHWHLELRNSKMRHWASDSGWTDSPSGLGPDILALLIYIRSFVPCSHSQQYFKRFPELQTSPS